MGNTLENAPKQTFAENEASFKASYDEEKLYIEFEGEKDALFTIMFALDNYYKPTVDINFKSGKAYIRNLYLGVPEKTLSKELDNYCVEFQSGDRDVYKVTIDREKLGWTEDIPLPFRLIKGETFFHSSWSEVENPFYRLGIYYVNEEFGKLLP
jgi:hypothetical protein